MCAPSFVGCAKFREIPKLENIWVGESVLSEFSFDDFFPDLE